MNIRRIGINMISGGAGYLVPMGINVLSTPFIISRLGNEAFGLQTIANVIIGYLAVADMGLDIPITRKVAALTGRDDHNEMSSFLVSTLKIYFLIGFAGLAALASISHPLLGWLSIPKHLESDAFTIFNLAGFGFLGSILVAWGKAIFNGMHRYEISNGVGIFNNVLGVSAGIILVALGFGVVAFIFARVASFLISALVYIFLTRKHMGTFRMFPFFSNQTWAYLKTQIGYGFLLRMSGMVFSKMDQTIISARLGVGVVTVYAVPNLIATAVNGLIASVTHFAFPMASSMSVSKSHDQVEFFFVRLSAFTVAISTLMFVPLIVLGNNLLYLWISPEMAEQAHEVLLVLVSSYYLYTCLATAVVSLMVGTGELRTFTVYGVGRGVFLFLCFIFMIRFFGLVGAGLSYSLTLILDTWFLFRSVKKTLKFSLGNLFLKAYLRPMLLGVVLGAGLYVASPLLFSWMSLFGAVVAFGFAYIVLGFVVGVFGETEKKAIFALLKRKQTGE